MLFRVSGSNVCICGTLHLLPDKTRLSPALFGAISTAEECVFESDVENAAAPDFARYASGDSLAKHITPELFEATSWLCQSLGIPGLLPQHKPWWVTLVVGTQLMMRAGNRLELGADRQLRDAAQRMGKRLSYLESFDAPLRAFDAAPISEQISRLQLLVSDPHTAVDLFNRLLAAWRDADIDALSQELQTLLLRYPNTFRSLTYDRNRLWLPKILDAITQRRSAVFVVGALHLAGNYSLLRLLKEQGHCVLPC